MSYLPRNEGSVSLPQRESALRTTLSLTLALSLVGFGSHASAQARDPEVANLPPEKPNQDTERAGQTFLSGAVRCELTGNDLYLAAKELAQLGSEGDPYLRRAAQALVSEIPDPGASPREHEHSLRSKTQILRAFHYVNRFRPLRSEAIADELAQCALELLQDQRTPPELVVATADFLNTIERASLESSHLASPLHHVIDSLTTLERDLKPNERSTLIYALSIMGQLGRGAYPNVHYLEQLADSQKDPVVLNRVFLGIGRLGSLAPMEKLQTAHLRFLKEHFPSEAPRTAQELQALTGLVEGLGYFGAEAKSEVEKIIGVLHFALSLKGEETPPPAFIALRTLEGICSSLDPQRDRELVKSVIDCITQAGPKGSSQFHEYSNEVLERLTERF